MADKLMYCTYTLNLNLNKLPLLLITIGGWNVWTLNFKNQQAKFNKSPKVVKPTKKKTLL